MKAARRWTSFDRESDDTMSISDMRGESQYLSPCLPSAFSVQLHSYVTSKGKC